MGGLYLVGTRASARRDRSQGALAQTEPPPVLMPRTPTRPSENRRTISRCRRSRRSRSCESPSPGEDRERTTLADLRADLVQTDAGRPDGLSCYVRPPNCGQPQALRAERRGPAPVVLDLLNLRPRVQPTVLQTPLAK
jgi:hypothetical protein